jgi:VWFA-related protein
MHRAFTASLTFLLILALSRTMGAQSPEPVQGTVQSQSQPQNQGEPAAAIVRTSTNLVVVPVTVKDDRNNIVAGLQKPDFRIFQDGAEQPIQFFSADAFPLSAVVLIDNDLSDKSAAQLQKSLETIAAGFGPTDEVAVVAYDEYPETVEDFTFNNDELFVKLKRFQIGSSFPGDDEGPMTAGPRTDGRSNLPGVNEPTDVTHAGRVSKCMDDAVYTAGQMLQHRGRDRRKIIFLISDGTNSHRNSHTFDQTVELLLQSNISVYTVSVGGPALLKKESSRLVNYANRTGGDYYYASKANALEDLYSKVTEEARNQYTLAFAPKVVKPKPSEAPEEKPAKAPAVAFHTIEVRVERPNLHVTAREGFYTGVAE